MAHLPSVNTEAILAMLGMGLLSSLKKSLNLQRQSYKFWYWNNTSLHQCQISIPVSTTIQRDQYIYNKTIILKVKSKNMVTNNSQKKTYLVFTR